MVDKRSAIGRMVVVVLVVAVVVIAAGGLYYYYESSSTTKTATVSLVGYHIEAVVANTGSGATTIDCTSASTGNNSASYIELENNSTTTAAISTIYFSYGGITTSSPTVYQYNAPGLSCAVSAGSTIYMNIHDLAIAPTSVKGGDTYKVIVGVTSGVSSSKLITSNPSTWHLYFSGTFS